MPWSYGCLPSYSVSLPSHSASLASCSGVSLRNLQERVRSIHRQGRPAASYSHSIVAGGFEEMSRATRLTPGTSLMIRFDTRSSRS